MGITLPEIPPEQIWMVVVGFLIAFVLAFGIGANDVANSFGTSVGSGVLSLKQAFILACIFETLGAVLLGAKVSDTIRKGIIDVEPYENNTQLLMAGNIAALAGSCVWLIAATLLRLPVSATHSIVGSTVGFALVVHGARGIHWNKLGMIIGSWFISPVLAGVVSVALFYVCKYFILSKSDPLEPGLRFLPVFYAVTIVVNMFSVFYQGPEMLGFDRIPLWGTFIISFGAGIIGAIIIRLFIVPWQRKRIKTDVLRTRSCTDDRPIFLVGDEGDVQVQADPEAPLPLETVAEVPNGVNNVVVHQNGNQSAYPSSAFLLTPPSVSQTSSSLSSTTPTSCLSSGNDSKINLNAKATAKEKALQSGRSAIKDVPETARLFSFLQILTAVFGSFAHGGNDVSNAIGPLVSLWLIATTGMVSQKAPTPIWILLYGGFGISLGLVVLGRKVIKTIGEDLARITPSSGFCIEIGSALTVLVASNIGIPISTTHCKVGSVVFVGRFRSRENVDWSIFRNIVLAWLVTLPISGGISAAIMAGLRLAVPQ